MPDPTKTELLAHAADLGVAGVSETDSKATIADAIEAHDRAAGPPPAASGEAPAPPDEATDGRPPLIEIAENVDDTVSYTRNLDTKE